MNGWRKAGLFLLIVVIGLPSWIGLALLVFTGRLRLRGNALFNSKKGMIIISNHPSLLEAGLLPVLLIINLIYGKKVISTPDSGNFFKKSWFSPFRMLCIPIFRGNPREELKSLELIKKKVREGHIVILFAEAGRTSSVKNGHLVMKNGERIRYFPQGLRKLFVDLDCQIGFVWCRGMDKVLKNGPVVFSSFLALHFWRKVEVVFGEVIDSINLPKSRKEVISFLEKKLLETSTK